MEWNNEKLQTLIERAWTLNDRLNDEIENCISFCRFCSNHGRYCDFGQTPFEERARLIAIRDSLKEVENTLLHLQVPTFCLLFYLLGSLWKNPGNCKFSEDQNVNIAIAEMGFNFS
ncbi:hypothetical protein CRYUN_Cryun14cG0042700 [Craigia yunnanensis]